MNYRIKHFDVLSVASIGALLYASVALVLAFVFFLFSSMIGAIFGHSGLPMPYIFPFMMMGPFLVVILPIVYGIFAFIALAIITALYNLFAGWTGGVLVTLQPEPVPAPGSAPQTLA